MRKILLVTAAALFMPLSAMAQSTMSAPASSGGIANTQANPSMAGLSTQDRNFIQMAAISGLAEVKAGQIAETKGNSTVQSIGTKMVTDHTKANDQLTQLALTKGVTAPVALPSRQQAMLAKLQAMSGSAFNTAYLKNQKTAHEHAIKVFKLEISDGNDPQLKAFASTTLPVLQQHLQMIEDAHK